MGEHTPTPWTVGLNGRSIIREVPDIADGCDHYMVAVASAHSLVSPDEAKANTLFIVEAVNSYDRHRATIAALVGALERAQVLARLVTVRQAINAGDDAVEASGLNPWAMNEGLADGTERISTHFIDSALQLARGSEVDE